MTNNFNEVALSRGAQKKAETIRKRQEAQKKKIIEYLEESPNLGVALARVGINRSTFSRWREDDPNFSLEARQAAERGIEHTADKVELSLLNSAREGNVQAQKYYLGSNHPTYMTYQGQSVQMQRDELTDERKRQIEIACRAWDNKDFPDERPEDYDREPGEVEEMED
jgi:hypothetical protein